MGGEALAAIGLRSTGGRGVRPPPPQSNASSAARPEALAGGGEAHAAGTDCMAKPWWRLRLRGPATRVAKADGAVRPPCPENDGVTKDLPPSVLGNPSHGTRVRPR